ncbi:MAG: hypothetical protein ACKVQS_12540 [Fimbriimonadaceae bacterium]
MNESRGEKKTLFGMLIVFALCIYVIPVACVNTLFSDHTSEINEFDRSIHLPKSTKVIDHKTSLTVSGSSGLNFNVFYKLKTTDKKELVSYLEIFSNPKWESDARFIDYELTESSNDKFKLRISLMRVKEWYELK